MPANVALTSPELSALISGQDDAPYYLSYKADTVIATGTVAFNPVGDSYMWLIVTGASAGWLNHREGMAAKITSSDGTILRGYYRIRRNSSSVNLLLIEQIAASDPGIIANINRTGPIQAGDLIYIIERFDLYSVKPFQQGDIIYQDGDVLLGLHNNRPELIVNMTINNRPGDFVTMIASDGGTQAITADITVNRWPPSAGSIVTYTWIVPSSWSGVSGGSTSTLTANVPPGDYVLYCDVFDSIAGQTEVCRWVRVHSPSDPPIPVNVLSDSEDRQSRKMTIRAVQGRISPIPPGAKCCITGPYTWGGSDVATANHQFIGFLDKQPYKEQPNYYESTADILGTGLILDTLIGAPVTFTYTGSVDSWEHLAGTLSTVQFAMWWVLRWRCANLLKCFNFTPLNTNSNTGRRRNIPIPQGSVFQQLNTLAEMVDANVGSRPDGEIIVQPIPSLLVTRTSVQTRCTLDESIFSEVSVNWRRHNIIGDVFHSGFYIADAGLTADVPVQGEAPGAQLFGQGGKTDKRTNKTYETVADNQQRVGLWLAYLNNEYPEITLTIPHNWDVFVMADLNRVIVDIPASKSPTGSAIALTCNPTSMEKKWIGGRKASIQLRLEAETTGGVGANIPIPPQQTPIVPTYNPIDTGITPSLPPIPDSGGTTTPTLPAGGSVLMPIGGDGMILNSAGSVYLTKSAVSLYSPNYVNVTPGSLSSFFFGTFQPTQVQFDPANGYSGTAGGAYALVNDSAGSQSYVLHTQNVVQAAPYWSQGTTLPKNYDIMRTNLTAGAVALYTSHAAGATLITTYDFTAGSQGFNGVSNTWVGTPTYIPGTGWYKASESVGVGIDQFCIIHKTIPAATIEYAIIYFKTDSAPSSNHSFGALLFGDQYGSGGFVQGGPGTVNASVVITTTSTSANETDFWISAQIDPPSGTSAGNITLTRVDLATGNGGAPSVIYSSNHGQSFGTAHSFGTGLVTGGFDISRNSGVSFAAGAGTVFKGTALGGGYSPYAGFTGASPACITIPWYRRNSTTSDQTSSVTPDILVGLDNGTMGLCWLLGGTSAPSGTIDITPTAGFTITSPNAITISYGKWIGVSGVVSGSRGYYESNDAGATWTRVSGIAPGAETRVRRNDPTFTSGRGAVFTLDSAGSLNYSSHFVTHGTFAARVVPEPIVFFDVYP